MDRCKVDVKPVPEHYWSISILMPAPTLLQFSAIGTQKAKPANLALVKKVKDDAPPGFEPVVLNYDKGIALIRILLKDKSEYDTIDAHRRTAACGNLFGLQQ